MANLSGSAVHAKGSFLYLQLWALGRAADADVLKKDSYDVVSASDLPFEGGATPRPLTEAEIGQYVADYASTAKAFVEQAGGDGVEIHMANGYLLHQFLDTNSNKRTDRYGGSVENRLRFPLEVAAAVVEAVGETKVGFRLAPFTTFQGMKMEKEEREATYTALTKEMRTRFPELAYLHLVEPRIKVVDEVEVEDGEDLHFIADLWAPKPLLVAGGLKAEDAEIVARQYPNAVPTYGRLFISNPDIVARIQHGVELTPHDRSTFYLLGPDQPEGYTTYPVVYGPAGKL